jgi:phosphatidylinositol kinase/protein kinase (PI-3  family)
MRVLRDNKDSLMAMLEAFVHDPLINWRLLTSNNEASGADDDSGGRDADNAEMEDGEETEATQEPNLTTNIPTKEGPEPSYHDRDKRERLITEALVEDSTR